MMCGLAAGLDAVRAVRADERLIMLIGGAAQNIAVTTIAAQAFETPVVVPAHGEYIADGAAVQAAWVLTGDRPVRPHHIVAAPDYLPVIRNQYALRRCRVRSCPRERLS